MKKQLENSWLIIENKLHFSFFIFMIFCGRVVEGVSTVSVMAEVLAGSAVFSVDILSLSVSSSNFSSRSLTGERGGRTGGSKTV